MRGYFVIADITGYTAFLTGSELDHAQDILKTLFNTLMDNIKPPLIISNFQGDAILTYTPDTGVVHGQTILELVENIYFAFAARLEQMQLNTTCRCNACANMGKLDLKLFAHYGEYALQDLRGRQELSGSDVIVVHRMMKNDVKEKHNIKAYALWTDEAIKALRLEHITDQMRAHSETYDHIGVVDMWVYDLKPRWGEMRDQRRLEVKLEDAWFSYELDVPVPPAIVWEYLNLPERRVRFTKSKAITVSDLRAGRVSSGSVFHCDHGDRQSLIRIVDWKPFEQFTEDCSGLPANTTFMGTTKLMGTTTGTHITLIVSKLGGRTAVSRLAGVVMTLAIKKTFINIHATGMRIVREMIDEDIASGKLSKLASVKVDENATTS